MREKVPNTCEEERNDSQDHQQPEPDFISRLNSLQVVKVEVVQAENGQGCDPQDLIEAMLITQNERGIRPEPNQGGKEERSTNNYALPGHQHQDARRKVNVEQANHRVRILVDG